MANVFAHSICKFMGRDEKHEMRHELEFGVTKNVKLHYSSQQKKLVEEWMGDSVKYNDT